MICQQLSFPIFFHINVIYYHFKTDTVSLSSDTGTIDTSMTSLNLSDRLSNNYFFCILISKINSFFWQTHKSLFKQIFSTKINRINGNQTPVNRPHRPAPPRPSAGRQSNRRQAPAIPRCVHFIIISNQKKTNLKNKQNERIFRKYAFTI